MFDNNSDPLSSLASIFGGPPTLSSMMKNNKPDAFAQALSFLASQPAVPPKWKSQYLESITERVNARINSLDTRLDDVRDGRTMPERDQVTIGSGVKFNLSILFLDICKFSAWPNSNHEEQMKILTVMNIFMAEMMNIVRDFGGIFEKNTGDGLMAYFGTETSSDKESVHPAVEAAVVMHYVNDTFISPLLLRKGLWSVNFRIGIDFGAVTIAKVGIPGGMNSWVALGAAANSACKLMDFMEYGGICIGDKVYKNLPNNWQSACTELLTPTGFIYLGTGLKYPGWILNHRLNKPF